VPLFQLLFSPQWPSEKLPLCPIPPKAATGGGQVSTEAQRAACAPQAGEGLRPRASKKRGRCSPPHPKTPQPPICETAGETQCPLNTDGDQVQVDRAETGDSERKLRHGIYPGSTSSCFTPNFHLEPSKVSSLLQGPCLLSQHRHYT
jgi:hypothetical protein